MIVPLVAHTHHSFSKLFQFFFGVSYFQKFSTGLYRASLKFLKISVLALIGRSLINHNECTTPARARTSSTSVSIIRDIRKQFSTETPLKLAKISVLISLSKSLYSTQQIPLGGTSSVLAYISIPYFSQNVQYWGKSIPSIGIPYR